MPSSCFVAVRCNHWSSARRSRNAHHLAWHSRHSVVGMGCIESGLRNSGDLDMFSGGAHFADLVSRVLQWTTSTRHRSSYIYVSFWIYRDRLLKVVEDTSCLGSASHLYDRWWNHYLSRGASHCVVRKTKDAEPTNPRYGVPPPVIWIVRGQR